MFGLDFFLLLSINGENSMKIIFFHWNLPLGYPIFFCIFKILRFKQCCIPNTSLLGVPEVSQKFVEGGWVVWTKPNLVKCFCPRLLLWTCVLCLCQGKHFNLIKIKTNVFLNSLISYYYLYCLFIIFRKWVKF